MASPKKKKKPGALSETFGVRMTASQKKVLAGVPHDWMRKKMLAAAREYKKLVDN